MVFVRPRGKGSQSETPSVISGLRRVESIKMLGVENFQSHSMSTTSWLCAPSHCLLCEHYNNLSQITGNSQHLIHPLLPPERAALQHYSLRDRSHNFQLPDRTSVTNDKNFIIRMLYNDNLY